MAQEIKLPGSPNQEPGMEKNLLIAFALMGLVIFGTQYFMPQPAPAPVKKAEAQPAPAPAPKSIGAAVPQSEAGPVTTAAKEDTYTIETKLYRVQFTNKGGVAKSWVLKNFKDSKGGPLELVHLPGTEKVGYPFALQVNGQDMNPNLNWYLFDAVKFANGLGIEFTYANGNNRAKKSFESLKFFKTQLFATPPLLVN